MSKLALVRRKLKRLDISFIHAYNEEKDISTITFIDVLLKEHVIKEDYIVWVGRKSFVELSLDRRDVTGQGEICQWIDRNIDLLTSLEAVNIKKAKELEVENRIKYLREIVYNKSYEVGDYTLTVKKERVGQKTYTIKNKNENTLPIINVESDLDYVEKPTVLISTFVGYSKALTVEETSDIVEKLQRTIIEGTTLQKIIDKENSKDEQEDVENE